ncbi:MAG: hypothetical protein WCL32_07425 [Planctomycetota bacterium]
MTSTLHTLPPAAAWIAAPLSVRLIIALACATPLACSKPEPPQVKVNLQDLRPKPVFVPNQNNVPQKRADDPALTVTWKDVHRIYGSSSGFTNLQKEQQWETFRGKQVRWSGIVADVREGIFGGITLDVKMEATTFRSDLMIELEDGQKALAALYKKGDPVTFEAILDNWGNILPFSLRKGQILDERMARPAAQEQKQGDKHEALFKGDSHWKLVKAFEMGSVLPSRDASEANAVTDGRFVLIQYTVESLRTDSVFFNSTPVLIDSQGREYQECRPKLIAEELPSILGKSLQRGEVNEFFALYEIPIKADGLRFQTRDLASLFVPDTKLIDLVKLEDARPNLVPKVAARLEPKFVTDGKPLVIKMREALFNNDSRWTVVNAYDLGRAIKSRDNPMPIAETTGRFVFVRYTVENLGKKSVKTSRSPKLIDARGQEFDQVNWQNRYIANGLDRETLHEFLPGLPREFCALYEVSRNAVGLHFQAKDLASLFAPDTKLIELE